MVLDGLLTSQECDELRQRMSVIVDDADVPAHCRTVFSTDQEEQLQEQVTHQSGRWLLKSTGDSVSTLNIIFSHAFHHVALKDAGKLPDPVKLCLCRLKRHNPSS